MSTQTPELPVAWKPFANVPDAEAIESVLVNGDLAKLTPAMRVAYYNRVCESLGLNPLTKPFDYISLNGKLVLYAKRDATEQLRSNRDVSVMIVARELVEDCYIVTARASLPTGRQDESIGAVNIAGLKGEARANALMKAETKAKRRVTLSICGLGLLDETEVETIAGPRLVVESPVASITAVATSPDAAANPSAPNGGDSGVIDVAIPDGAVLIRKVEGGFGKTKGFLKHSGQPVSLHGQDGIAMYDDRLVTLASELCQSHTPVYLEIVTSASGKPYVKKITAVKPEPTDAELDAEIVKRELARQAGEVS